MYHAIAVNWCKIHQQILKNRKQKFQLFPNKEKKTKEDVIHEYINSGKIIPVCRNQNKIIENFIKDLVTQRFPNHVHLNLEKKGQNLVKKWKMPR
jgi:hypothetical protein